jgi:probable phosphoglycerate mutase
MKVYVFRHARAGGNRRHILNGSRRDVSLTTHGRQQAQKIAQEFLFDEKPDLLLCSNMKRAYQTAYYFEKKFGLKAQRLQILNEHDLGDWTGKSAKKLKHEFAEYFFDYEDGTKSHFLKKVPNGESWEDTKKRAKSAITQIKHLSATKKCVVVICHGIMIMAMINLIAKIKPPKLWAYRLHNCDYVKFEF